MTTFQTICIIVGGYPLSRLLLAAQLHEAALRWLIHRSSGKLHWIALAVMALSFLLSTFIPNALTVLAFYAACYVSAFVVRG